MQSALATESVTVSRNGVEVKMNGNMEITNVNITSDSNKESLSGAFKDATNDAIKQTQKLMAKKMQEMGGFPGLK